MRKNVGGIDKGLRIAAGLALLALGACSFWRTTSAAMLSCFVG